ncbi:MAG: glycerophosphodiester phosphodiesterase [Bacteroidetes bacterium]|nr:glycerophosphodiester phosphodiesterase [Bacteroidota bacterium]
MKSSLLLCSGLLFCLTSFGQKFDIEGHRGCRGLLPENTIPAFIKAVQLGVTTLEMDVVVTRDGQLVISHDPVLNDVIMTKPDGTPVTAEEAKKLRIFDMPYAEIKKYDAGLRGNPKFPDQQKIAVSKPLLKEVIDTVEKYVKAHKLPPVYYNIETKSTKEGDDVYNPKPNVFAQALYDVVAAKKIVPRCIIQSFDPRTLQEMKKIDPNITTALLVANINGFDKNIAELGFPPAIYSPEYHLVNKKLIAKCHALNIRVIPWTVNDEKTMRKLKDLGADGLISDYPDKAIKALK